MAKIRLCLPRLGAMLTALKRHLTQCEDVAITLDTDGDIRWSMKYKPISTRTSIFSFRSGFRVE